MMLRFRAPASRPVTQVRSYSRPSSSRSSRRIIPWNDHVLVERRRKEARSAGGLMLPEQNVKQLNEGVVVAVGKGKRTMDGKFLPMTIKVGDNVLMMDNRGTEIKLDDKDYILLREDEILGILEDTDEPIDATVSTELPDVKDLPK